MSARFVPNRPGINSLMKTPETGAEVRRIARRISVAAAGADGDFRTDAALGAMRWRAAVIGNYNWPKSGGLRGSRRALLSALDGGGE
ncbi:hypothetical protein [Streptomyces huiliensis]|uniref:hypothetical protein n=1 Tax=Streptomyces huiliensis TaxID=2876027 RepID=UPI001CBBD46B|nr:hypothetical protein [Streptomyces huiliensis]MBZ4319535.1 hypothetical protein [Streptomyces huiliensis]